MQISAIVRDVSTQGANILIYVTIVTDQGDNLSDAIEVNPTRTVAQLNGDVAAGIRQSIRTQTGKTVAENESLTLIGGITKT